jgi:UMP-CMP kinase
MAVHAWTTTTTSCLPAIRYRGGSSFLRDASPVAPLSVARAADDAALSAAASSAPEDWRTQALALALPPVDSFGGIEYWNVAANNSNNNTTSSRKPAFRVVFVLGGPGAGKGTQSEFLAAHYPVVHLSVGELLRDEQTKKDSPHAALIQQAMMAGGIVPVEISLSLLRQAMHEASADQAGDQCIFLVDGFPRNEDNLSGWCRFMAQDQTPSGEDPSTDGPSTADLWGVLVYQCPEAVLEERILERAKASGRSDDNLESVRKRFRTFQEQTQPIIDELDNISNRLQAEQENAAVWKVWEISGDQRLPDVTQNTQQVMNQLIRNDILSANRRLLEAIERGDVEAYQALCDPLWFDAAEDPASVMRNQEGGNGSPVGAISDARMEFVSGKHVTVTYNRRMDGQSISESRVWVHKGTDGWQNVHFARTPSP